MNNAKSATGFNLIETMITMSLMAIVIALGALYWNYITDNYSFSMNQFELTDRATFSTKDITTEIRQAEEAMNGAYSLEILEDNQLAFYADVDNDDLTERRRYFLENGSLKRGVIKPTGSPPTYPQDQEKITTIVDRINETQLPLFIYYNGAWPADQTNNPLTYWERPLETRLIKVRIPVYTQSDRDGRHEFIAESVVSIRNLKDN